MSKPFYRGDDFMKKYLFFPLLFLVFFSQAAAADFYTWEDEKGEMQITDYPPPTDKTIKNIQIHQHRPEDYSNLSDDRDQSAIKKATVVIYTKNDCEDCDKAKDYLTSKNIPFTEYNTDTDVNAAIKRKEVDNGEEVPFAIINRNHVYGFSENVYDRVLKMEP